MPLESCMLILDNSEYMRNGDYPPTRFQAQAEAVSTVFTAKTDSNPESAVGLMTMAGKSPSLLVTPTNDLGKLLSSLSKVQISGISNLSTSINIAQLSLKHRENKNQRQKIICFIGSPIDENETKESLNKLGKKLRKNNVSIDIITFGEEGRENDDKLNGLIQGVGGDDSHLLSIPPGPRFLSDVILSSPILFDGEGPVPGGSGSGGDGGVEGGFGGSGEDGIDPNMDPELAMAIRMSLQEAQEAAARANPPSTTTAEQTSTTTQTAGPSEPLQQQEGNSASGSATLLPSAITQPLSNSNDSHIPMVSGDSTTIPGTTLGSNDEGLVDNVLDEDNEDDEDEDEELRRAMALSRGDDVDMEGDEDDDEAAIARAIAMSLEEAKDEENKEPKS
ncbi:uncharacterized protein L201_005124 [Kwoniella dendrophila CBS 6074]|uniref:VWFA domain-containing protein n=1 Tax=Kwoniella dendrophila CBS 6074 TaxID=1295534 RepID=A0AAX4JXK2_9TREE